MKYAVLFALALGVFGLSAYFLQESRVAQDQLSKVEFLGTAETPATTRVSASSTSVGGGEQMQKKGEVEGFATVVFSKDGKEAEVLADLPEPIGGRYELQIHQPNKREGSNIQGVVLKQEKAGYIGKIRIPEDIGFHSELIILWIPEKSSRTASVLFSLDLR